MKPSNRPPSFRPTIRRSDDLTIRRILFPIAALAALAAPALDFSQVAAVTIPEGAVESISTLEGEVLWKRLYDAEVEWIGSDGAQYIDTGIAPDSATTRVAARIYIPASKSVYAVFGSRSALNVKAYNLFGYQDFGTKPYTLRFDFGEDADSAKVQNYTGSNIAAGWWDIELNGRALSMANGSVSQTLTARKTAASNPYPMYLFSVNTAGVAWNAATVGVRCSSFRIWQSGVLVRDLIPVRIGSEGCLYDRRGVGGMDPDGSARNDGIYRNQGTGAFAVGPDKTNQEAD